MRLVLVALLLIGCGVRTADVQNDSSWRSKIAHPPDGKFDEFLSSQEGTASILVVLNAQANLAGANGFSSRRERGRFVYEALTQTAGESQADLIAWLSDRGLKHKPFYVINMVAVSDVTWEQLANIASRSDVKRIAWDPEVNLLPTPIVSASRPSEGGVGSNIVHTGANRVWEELGITGEHIVVAGQDTGVEWTHPALSRQYRGRSESGAVSHDYNWHDAIVEPISSSNRCGYDIVEPCDDHGHGTHTVGTILGNDGADNVIGMAPGAQWIACRNMDAGIGRPSTYIDCFEYFLAPYPRGANPLIDGNSDMAPHVINNSWGCNASEGCSGEEILPVMEALTAAGVMIVASAGNEGPSCSTIGSQPATHSEMTFSVGAMNHDSETMAAFSSRGPSLGDGGLGPDVVAPGVSIRSSVPGGSYESYWSGTSMAAPHVVGQVALLWSAAPSLLGDIAQTTEIVRSTALPLPVTEQCGGIDGRDVPNNTSGYGMINAYNAVKAALAAEQISAHPK